MVSMQPRQSREMDRRSTPRRETGATLIVALIFLVILTLLVFSGVKTGALSFLIANNVQYQREAIAVAQAVIDSKLTSNSFFASPPTTSSTDTSIPNYTVTLYAPKCLGIGTSEETGKKTQYGGPIIPYYLWELEAQAVNTATGTKVNIVQGVKLQQSIGSICPN